MYSVLLKLNSAHAVYSLALIDTLYAQGILCAVLDSVIFYQEPPQDLFRLGVCLEQDLDTVVTVGLLVVYDCP